MTLRKLKDHLKIALRVARHCCLRSDKKFRSGISTSFGLALQGKAVLLPADLIPTIPFFATPLCTQTFFHANLLFASLLLIRKDDLSAVLESSIRRLFFDTMTDFSELRHEVNTCLLYASSTRV